MKGSRLAASSGLGKDTGAGESNRAEAPRLRPLRAGVPVPSAAVGAMEALRKEEMTVQAVQDRFPTYGRAEIACRQ